MAKKSKEQFQIRRVKSKEDRKRPSVFMRLKTDEMFKAIALFEPDPELDDNPGYYEYYDHYDKQGNSYVPCAGDQCPFCAANDNPSTRALTVWYYPENDKGDQIKVFTMNYSTLTDVSDEAEEEEGILGKKLRIKRLSDKGDYKVRVLSDKPLSKTELKKAMKALEEKFGEEGLEGLVMRQLKAQMERLKALDELEDNDDDDDDEEETTKKGNSKSRKGKPADDEEDDEDDDDEEEEDDDEDDDDDSDDEDDEDEEESDDDDEDGDEDDDDGDDEDEEDEEEDEPESTEISAVEYEVVKFQPKDEILDLKNEDGKIKMWVGEGVDADADELKKGVKVTVTAEQDDEGDWIITALKVKKARGGKAAGGKKAGDKGKGGKKK